jgi:hypothetical protein
MRDVLAFCIHGNRCAKSLRQFFRGDYFYQDICLIVRSEPPKTDRLATMQDASTATKFGFLQWQAIYAEHRIALFPVKIGETEKRPAVRNYLKIGCSASRKIAQQFPDATAFGFAVGERSRITVLDVDSPDENVFTDAITRHGKSPIIVRSGSNNFQSWYRWNGEGRWIRPDPTKPIDVLGKGYVVAPPSLGRTATYEFIEGSLDDLDSLPILTAVNPRRLPGERADVWRRMRDRSGRNNALFHQLGRDAHSCDDFDQLLDRARTLNENFGEPLDDNEAISISGSVWKMTTEGRNRFAQHGAYFSEAEVDHFARDPHVFTLLGFLKAKNGPHAKFMVADGLQHVLNWPRRQLANARKRAVDSGLIVRVSRPGPGRAARYVWSKSSKEGTKTLFVEDHLPKLVGVAKGGFGPSGKKGDD